MKFIGFGLLVLCLILTMMGLPLVNCNPHGGYGGGYGVPVVVQPIPVVIHQPVVAVPVVPKRCLYKPYKCGGYGGGGYGGGGYGGGYGQRYGGGYGGYGAVVVG